MSSWQIIAALTVAGVICFSAWFLYRENRSGKKVPYHKLFKEKKKKEYLVRSNRFIAWLVVIFFASIFSIGFLFKITLISVPLLLCVLALITAANVLFFRKKYQIKKQDLAFLSLVIGMGQLSLFLWLNFIPVNDHYEAYKIEQREIDESSNLTTIHLENAQLSQYWTLRTFESSSAPRGDTIVYHFKDGLIGFRVYQGHESY